MQAGGDGLKPVKPIETGKPTPPQGAVVPSSAGESGESSLDVSSYDLNQIRGLMLDPKFRAKFTSFFLPQFVQDGKGKKIKTEGLQGGPRYCDDGKVPTYGFLVGYEHPTPAPPDVILVEIYNAQTQELVSMQPKGAIAIFSMRPECTGTTFGSLIYFGGVTADDPQQRESFNQVVVWVRHFVSEVLKGSGEVKPVRCGRCNPSESPKNLEDHET